MEKYSCSCLGDGELFKIWQHHWLPIKHLTLVSSPLVNSLEEATIDSLIIASTRQWDSDMIDGIFAPQEANFTKHIPLARCVSADSIFWTMSQDGQYSCKSGYKFLKVEATMDHHVEPSLDEKNLWNGIWSLNSPNKVKKLMWRACQNFMLMKSNLVWQTIINCPLCDQCKAVLESPLYALWSCLELDLVWSDATTWIAM